MNAEVPRAAVTLVIAVLLLLLIEVVAIGLR